MAPLRFQRSAVGDRPFTVVGVDFFGPELVLLRFGQSSRRKRVKRYSCLFICFATRAVHLEVCNSLSTDSLICALIGFLYSTGHSTKQIWTDNGSNLIGADNEIAKAIQTLDESQIVNVTAQRGVDWKYFPARSSHQGGLWEVMVRETKVLLKFIYNDVAYRTLNDEEFLTYIKEIENVLNCCSLTPLSDDPTDFSYLSLMSILHLDLKPSLPFGKPIKSDGLRKSWKTALLMADQFWSCWRMFSIPLLHKRSKWTSVTFNLVVGDLVLLKDYKVARNQWSRARIVATLPDRDGIMRRVEIMTPNRKRFIRAEGYICPLEMHV